MTHTGLGSSIRVLSAMLANIESDFQNSGVKACSYSRLIPVLAKKRNDSVKNPLFQVQKRSALHALVCIYLWADTEVSPWFKAESEVKST